MEGKTLRELIAAEIHHHCPDNIRSKSDEPCQGCYACADRILALPGLHGDAGALREAFVAGWMEGAGLDDPDLFDSNFPGVSIVVKETRDDAESAAVRRCSSPPSPPYPRRRTRGCCRRWRK